MTRFFAIVIPAHVVILLGLWCSAADAQQAPVSSESCDYVETDCSIRPLENGRPGETVRECKVRVVCTTVQHIGR